MRLLTPANAAFRPDGTGGGVAGNFWESESIDTIRLLAPPWGKAKFDSSAGRAILADNYFNTDQTARLNLVAGGSTATLETAGLNFFMLDDVLGSSITQDLKFTTNAIGPIVEDTAVPGDHYRLTVAAGVVVPVLVP